MQCVYSNLGIDIFKDGEGYCLQYVSGLPFIDEKMNIVKITEDEFNAIMAMDGLEVLVYVQMNLKNRVIK